MKVLIVHNRYRSSSPSGEDRVVDQEHAALASAGHEVARFERRNDEIDLLPLARRATMPADVVWNRQSARQLDAVLARDRPDVVHVHNLFPLLSPSVLRSCERAKVPCVATFHNFQQACLSGDLYRAGAPCRDCAGHRFPLPGVVHGCYHGSPVASLPLAISAVAHRRAWRSIPSAYLFLSEAQRRELRILGFPSDRCFVKPNFAPRTARRGRAEPLVVFTGRLAEIKGVRILMRAWDRYLGEARQRPQRPLRLAIAGAGPLQHEVRAWASERSTVEFLGLLNRDECARLVRRAAVVLAPSEWIEPFGLVVVEAMAAGVAPVAPAHGAFPELIHDGVDGLLYPSGDDGALARILGRVDEDPAWIERLGDAALATYEGRFCPERVVAELETIYRFAVEHPRWLDHTVVPGSPGDPSPEPAMYQRVP